MERKPDVIRAVLLVFAIGLAISGFTSIRTSEEGVSAAPVVSEAQAPRQNGLN
ncbi:MAG: hypothetical protein R3280_01715 [Marinobacter sp.]|uniref:hypothetical protein n=1 Tax=Marinobacter sp. TaxID=50741 RepID=UPI00299DC59B|nr:hypothetical protein [Marinobacter sp.]MDX1633331.1 hypothetical protein [Marinobacter sp.]